MADLMTLDDMADGKLDLTTLKVYINGDENTVNKPRLMPNVDVGSLAKLNKSVKDKVDLQIATIPAGRKGYATLAAAQAAQASLAANTLVEVTNDTTTANNGVYLWNGTTLTKSTYEPLAQSKSYTDTKLKTIDVYTASREAYLTALAKANDTKPKAAIVILLGQSLNAPRDTQPILVSKAAPVAKMPIGGSSTNSWKFYQDFAEGVGNWSELASTVDYTESKGQTPSIGIINTLANSKFARLYVGNAAIPARKIEILMSAGAITNTQAMIYRLCKIARQDGFDPVVMFYSAHGEANAAAATTEQAYYDLAIEYYSRCQLYAAQAMRKPDYIAPVALSYMAESAYNNGTDDRTIKSAIKRVIQDLPNAIDIGAIYQWDVSSDMTHPTPKGYIMRGEAVGKAFRDYFERQDNPKSLYITDVTLSGTTFVATFNMPIIKDANANYGQSLSSKDGFEWIDNGTPIAISNITYSGWQATGTLASAPIGTLAQQVLRIANQKSTSGSAPYMAGSVVRANTNSWVSIIDANYNNYVWAVPQQFTQIRGV